MKIAVYTIALNEGDFVERWAESAREADYLFVADTGSTDHTIQQLQVYDVHFQRISVQPWRFDDARNAALAMLPADIDACVVVDMDEVLLPGWREGIEAAGIADQWNNTVVAGEIAFPAQRCHSRHGWRWVHPIHETIEWKQEWAPTVVDGGFVVKHLPDNSKPRTQYLDMLRQAVAESPDDPRLCHYYGRELFFRGFWPEARVELLRHVTMPQSVWADERSQSYRYLAKMDYYPERWLLKAAAEAPHRREPWVDLAKHYQEHADLAQARGMALRASQIPVEHRAKAYMSENDAWDDAFLDRWLAAEDRSPKQALLE